MTDLNRSLNGTEGAVDTATDDVQGFVYTIGGVPVGVRATGTISSGGHSYSGTVTAGYRGWLTSSRTYNGSINVAGVRVTGRITSVR